MIIPSCIAQPRSLAASQPKEIPIYVGARHSRKYLISSMKHLKPATATSASAGIRRMEPGQPPALGMRTCGGKGARQWLLAMGCAKRDHPSRKVREVVSRHSDSNRSDSMLNMNLCVK